MTEKLSLEQKLPVGSDDKNSVGWWGIWTLILTEASLFGYLLVTYFYLYAQTAVSWPPEGLPKLLMPGINTAILLSSSIWVWSAEQYLKRGSISKSLTAMGMAIAFGGVFVAIQLREWKAKSYGVTSNLYGSLYYTVTGFHMAHVIVGLIILSLLLLWIRLGYFTARNYTAVRIGGLYWHFVDAVWVFVFASFYLIPYVRN